MKQPIVSHSNRCSAKIALFSLSVVWLISVSPHARADSPLIQRAMQGGGPQTVAPPASVEVAFSPESGATGLVVKAIVSAKKTIQVAAYSFTSRPIARALVDARRAGVDVEVVVDHDQIDKDNHSAIPFLADAGIPIRIDIVHTLQHDKYMVIDGTNVETGSFNYTAAAEEHNSENVIVLWGAPQLAAAYTKDWKNLWDQAETYQKR